VEPASLLVCELDGVVKGYLMGCRRPLIKQAYQAFANVAVAAKAIYRCYARPYNESSRTFLRWVLRNAWRELPVAPRNTPHFHINILPEAKSVASTRALIQAFLTVLHERGHRSVCGQMVTFATRRTEALFSRYGFRVVDQVEVTKYRGLYPGRVLLSPVVKDLNGALAQQIERVDRDGPCGSDHHHRAVRPETAQHCLHRAGIGHGGEDRAGTAQFAQRHGGVGARAVDVLMRPERARERFLVAASI